MEGKHSGLYRPNVAAQNQDFYEDNEKLIGVSVAAAEDSVPQLPCTSVKPSPQQQAVGQVFGLGQKRKRGRLTMGRRKEEEEEEDVCFICFDGGCLVLCDRKGCSKAYHPVCIKRDEAFFRSNAKWICGWHICSVCQKASHYMCYTCTYSLCKGCTKTAEYVCVRGNKGFCSICMRTIMLIENKGQINSESIQVDFDDNSSWEYLFKAYWIYLKEKLSLTPKELTQAKNPCKEVGTVVCKNLATDVHHNTLDRKVSILYRSSEHLESIKSKGQLNLLNKDSLSTDSLDISNEVDPSLNKGKDKSSIDEGTDKPSVDEGTEWASKDLLELVAHMRNGDTSVLSLFDVQSLLLEYVKRNNLRDPSQKSRIICDLRLKNLFGKPRIGHIEMLKLLEFHFLIKENSHSNAFVPVGTVVPVANDMNGQFHGISEFPYYAPSRVLELGSVPDNRLPEGNGAKNSSYSIARTQYQMNSGCDLEDQSNNQSQASQLSGENLRSLPGDLYSNSKHSRSDMTPLPRSPDLGKEDGDICLSDLSSPKPKASSKDWEVQNAEKQQSVSTDIPVQNSDILDLPSPTSKPSDEDQATDTKQSLLVMNGAHLPEIANKWCGYFPTPAKPSVEEWDNDLVIVLESLLKPPEAISGHAAIQTTNSNQNTHFSQYHLTSDFPNWPGIVDEPIEFDALGVESVSDLLAEVDAMESRSDPASPTSAAKFCKELMQDFGKELIEDSKDYCFGSIDNFCQTPYHGNSSSLSSTRDTQLTCQPTVACEPLVDLAASQVHTPDHFRSLGGRSSSEIKSKNTPV